MMGYESNGARLARLRKVDTSKDPTPPAPYWQHEVGTTLAGVFRQWWTAPGNSEIPERMAIIEDDSGSRYAVGCRLTMLKKGFEKENPQPGDRITIRRGEDKDVGKRNPLKTFWITVDRNNGSPPRADWNLEEGTR